MKRFTVAVVTISGVILGPACQALVGIEDRVEAPLGDEAGAPDTSTTTPETGGGDAPVDVAIDTTPPFEPSKNCPVNCLPVAPNGWKGPSATYDGAPGTKPALCPSWYTEKEIEANQGMTAAAHTCDCGTAKITGRSCSWTVRNCNGGGIIAKVSSCALVDDVNNLFSFKIDSPFFTAGSCSYPNQKTVAPAPSFTKTNVACGLKEPTACDSDGGARPDCVAAPVPDQPYGKICIHKEGEVPCPSADYANRFVAYKNVDDKRVCSACSGTANAGTCGSGKWSIRGAVGDCDVVNLSPDKDINTCYSSADGSEVIDVSNLGPSSGTCTTTAGTPSGIATAIDPVTFCCNL